MITRIIQLCLALSGCLLLTAANVHAAESRAAVRAEMNKPEIRGSIVYKFYCQLCHGERGDGVSRAAKNYGQGILRIKPGGKQYYEDIIRLGGEAIGKSEFMPPWQEELSKEQITDVIAYLSIVTDEVARGRTVFKTNCILCHGTKGDGQGRAARMYDPPPANLTRSDKNDMYKKMIITYGGEAMGRSKFMPMWGEQLTEQEIEDLVAYLRTILVIPPPTDANL